MYEITQLRCKGVRVRGGGEVVLPAGACGGLPRLPPAACRPRLPPAACRSRLPQAACSGLPRPREAAAYGHLGFAPSLQLNCASGDASWLKHIPALAALTSMLPSALQGLTCAGTHVNGQAGGTAIYGYVLQHLVPSTYLGAPFK